MTASSGAELQLSGLEAEVRCGWRAGQLLTQLEREVRRKSKVGELVDMTCDAQLTPDEMPKRRWRRHQTIRAKVLRHLLVDNQWPVHEKGVRLKGVRILGQLDLEAATIRCPVRLDSCFLDGPAPALGFAAASLLTLTGCHLAGLAAESIAVSKDLDLSDSAFSGPVDLQAADIAGWLICSNAKLHGSNKQGNALVADLIKVGASVALDGICVTQGAGAIRLTGAQITGQLNCRRAQLNGRDKEHNSLIGDWMKVGSSGVVLADAHITEGAVRLAGADITGQLNCRHAQLDGYDKDGCALIAFRMRVRGDVLLDRAPAGDKRFTAAGTIKLTGADINGKLSLSGAHLKGGADTKGKENTERAALSADSVKIGGSMMLNDEFMACGTVRVAGADIIGRLVCTGAELNGSDERGCALLADALQAGGGVSLDEVHTTRGGIRLIGADITRELRCNGAILKGADQSGNAMLADQVKVSGDLRIGVSEDPSARTSAAEGALSLRSARVDGSLWLEPDGLAERGQGKEGKVAIDLAGAQIAHDLVWKPRHPVSGQVILEDAEVGGFEDRLASTPKGNWPSARQGRLRLDGFTYKRIRDEPGVTWLQRLEWIGSPRKPASGSDQLVFATQPYEQLAQVYRQAGKDREARKVAIARRRDLRRYGDIGLLQKIGNWLLDITIRYGYRTWRALLAITILYGAFLGFSIFAQHHDLIIATQSANSLRPVPAATQCVKYYPCFYPPGYAIDAVIPIINVHQADYWGPNGHASWGWVSESITWLAVGLGWALATLLVAGYTGLVRRD